MISRPAIREQRRRLMVVVTNSEADGSPETHVFPDSPITVGRSPLSALRLPDPRVEPQQGVLFFTSSAIKYLDCSNPIVAPGDPSALVHLTGGAALRIAPFEISTVIEIADEAAPSAIEGAGTPFFDELERVFRAIGLVASALSSDNRAATFTALATRAVEVLDIVSQVIVERQRARPLLWIDGDAPLLLRGSSNPPEITDYLLDPLGSGLRLEELRQYLRNLSRSEAVFRKPVARA
jgi:hypothetical protein